MPKKTKLYRTRLLKRLKDKEEASHYVNAALRDSTEMFLEALKDVVQANQVAKVARDAKVTREHIYRSLSLEGNPTWDTLNAIFKVLGLQFSVVTRRPHHVGVTEKHKYGIKHYHTVILRRALQSVVPTQMDLEFNNPSNAAIDSIAQAGIGPTERFNIPAVSSVAVPSKFLTLFNPVLLATPTLNQPSHHIQ